jgi:hypothetical protein
MSVIKSSLMLEKGFILPNVNFETPNEQIPMEEWNMKVSQPAYLATDVPDMEGSFQGAAHIGGITDAVSIP